MRQYIAKLTVVRGKDGAEVTGADVISTTGTSRKMKHVDGSASVRMILCSRITWVVDLSHVGFALVKLMSVRHVPATTITGDGNWLLVSDNATHTFLRNASAILPACDDLFRIRDTFKALGIGEHTNDPFTMSMLSLRNWVNVCPEARFFDNAFLTPGQYENARAAYRGGYTYQRPGLYRSGVAIDINSLYPWAAISHVLPFGGAFDNQIQIGGLCYQFFRVRALLKLKEGGIPWVSDVIKQSFATVDGRVYLDGVWITETDLNEMYKDYDVENYEGQPVICDIMTFKGIRGADVFGAYLLPLYAKKRTLPNSPERDAVKLEQNALLGTFGRSDKRGTLFPKMVNGKVKYFYSYEEKYSGDVNGYMPLAAAVTSYGRARLLDDIRTVGLDRVIYANTDSIFMTGKTLPKGMEISDRLGKYKIEKVFSRASIVGHCCYFLDDGASTPKIAAPGLSKAAKEKLTSGDFYRFRTGAKFEVDGWAVAEDGCKVPCKKVITIKR